MKPCPTCHHINPDSSQFCGECGRPLPAGTHNHENTKREEKSSKSWVEQLNEYVGNDSPADLNWRMLFTDVFKSHTTEEAEEIFICGTKTTTPDPRTVSRAWPRPWLYSRIFITFLIAFALLWVCVDLLSNTNALPGLIVVGSFAVPLSTLVLFMETNVWRNVSMFHILKTFLLGGCASLVASLLLFEIYPVGDLDFFGAFMVGIIEETGKAVIIYALLRRFGKLSVLTGLLIGACVGAGFAAFESSGYALQPLVSFMQSAGFAAAYGQSIGSLSDLIEQINQIIFLRGILSPGGHVAWAAITGAGIAIAAEMNGRFDSSIISNNRFLRLFAISVVLHGLWDSPLALWCNEIFPFLGYIALIIIVWIVVLILINMGLSEVSRKTYMS